MGTKSRIYNRHIRLCAAYQEMYRQSIVTAGLSDQLRRMPAMGILTVAGSLLHIGFQHFFHYLRMSAFIVIALK